MNYLAHLFLGQNNVNLLIGNFIADQVKGKQINSFSKEVQQGIRMHRMIDEYTDNHKIVKESKQLLYSKYRKYAPVIVDIYYDYFLAKNWSNYSPISLESFANNCYTVLNSKKESFPEQSQRILNYMSKQDWLSNYSKLSGIEMALLGMSRRAKFDSKMEQSITDLEEKVDIFELHFNQFFPDLFVESRKWLEK